MSTNPIYRVRTVLSGWQGGPGLGTFYFDGLGAPSAGDALAAVNRVRGSWDVVKSIFATSVTMQTSGLVDLIDPVDGTLVTGYSVATPAVVTGTGSSTSGPSQTASGLILDTGIVVSGRRLRGRAFIGPLSSSLTNTVSPATGVGTAIDAMGVALLTVSPPATPPVGVWHRPVFTEPGHTLSRAGSFAPALTSTHSTKWFTIRSRRD